jgi:hypothetical protein
LKSVVLVNNDVLRVASICDWTGLGLGVVAWAVRVLGAAVVSADHASLAIVFFSVFAVVARTA